MHIFLLSRKLVTKNGLLADEVDMVGHQAIAENIEAEPLELLFENFEIGIPVGVNKENILLIIAMLEI